MCASSVPLVKNPNVRILLFRHGETEWNVRGQNQGHIDIPLNETGRIQAQHLVSILEHEPIEAILSSDLSRAVQTAEPTVEKLKVPFVKAPELREAFLGEAQGLTNTEVKERYGKEFLLSWRSAESKDLETRYPGGENGREVLERVLRCLQAFCDQKPYQCIGVATHGGVIRRVLQHLNPPNQVTPMIENTSVHPLFYSRIQKRFFLS